MISTGALTVLFIVGAGLVPIAGIVIWIVGWVLHGLGGPTGWALRSAVLAGSVAAGTALLSTIGALQGRTSVAEVAGAMWGVAIPLVIVVWLAASGRRRFAGLVLAGVALPWTAVYTAYLADIVAGDPWDLPTTVALWLIGAVPLLLGTALAILGDPVHDADPGAPAGRPGSRRLGAYSRAIVGAASYGVVGPGLLVGLAALTVTGLVTASPALAGVVGIAACLGATEAQLRWLPPDFRPAIEAFHWVGARELAIFDGVAGGRKLRSLKAFRRWLEETPETDATRALRVDLLTGLERYEEAAAAIERMPTDTPAAAFQRALLEEDVAWHRGGAFDIERVRGLATAIGPDEDEARLLADGRVAWAESQVRHAALDPAWMAPLAAFRPRVPDAAGLHASMLRVPTLAGTAPAVAIIALFGFLAA